VIVVIWVEQNEMPYDWQRREAPFIDLPRLLSRPSLGYGLTSDKQQLQYVFEQLAARVPLQQNGCHREVAGPTYRPVPSFVSDR
jgi:hypothetical protein